MNVSDEQLMAYVDGELDGEECARVEQFIRDDPQIARRVDAQRRLRARLGVAFNDTLDEPVPERLIAAARGGKVVSLANEAARRGPLRRRPGGWFALAACLVAGIAIGVVLPVLKGTRDEVRIASDGGLVAGGDLAQALESRPASATGGRIALGLTLLATDGRYCRTFSIDREDRRAGLACRDDSGWRIDTLERRPRAGGDTGYQTAGSGMSDVLRDAVSARIVGEALDAAQETQAIRDGWRKPGAATTQ
jgi:putative zinc finger protein